MQNQAFNNFQLNKIRTLGSILSGVIVGTLDINKMLALIIFIIIHLLLGLLVKNIH